MGGRLAMPSPCHGRPLCVWLPREETQLPPSPWTLWKHPVPSSTPRSRRQQRSGTLGARSLLGVAGPCLMSPVEQSRHGNTWARLGNPPKPAHAQEAVQLLQLQRVDGVGPGAQTLPLNS